MMKKSLKIVVIGDGACGKTSLILAQSGGPFSEDYTPTAFDDYAIEALINGKTKILTVCDTAGEDDFSSLRPLSYPDTDVFILCYSVERPESIRRLREKWIPEIKQFCPHTPMLIVGNKKDIRDSVERRLRHSRNSTGSSSEQPVANVPPMVDLHEASECAQEFSSFNLIECSAKTREGVRKVFETAITAAMTFRSKQSNKVLESIMKLKLVF